MKNIGTAQPKTRAVLINVYTGKSKTLTIAGATVLQVRASLLRCWSGGDSSGHGTSGPGKYRTKKKTRHQSGKKGATP